MAVREREWLIGKRYSDILAPAYVSTNIGKRERDREREVGKKRGDAGMQRVLIIEITGTK